MLLMMYRYRSAAVSCRPGISDITRTATRTRKEGSGLQDRGLYIPAVQAELSFSLVLVKSFIVFSTAGCALVAPGIVRYKAHGMSYPKRGVHANPSNPPWLHPCCD